VPAQHRELRAASLSKTKPPHLEKPPLSPAPCSTHGLRFMNSCGIVDDAVALNCRRSQGSRSAR
jgi:hypothetical protein